MKTRIQKTLAESADYQSDDSRSKNAMFRNDSMFIYMI